MAYKRRRSLLRFLWKRKVFITLLLILGAIAWGSNMAIQAVNAHTKRLAELQEQLDKVDFSKEPSRWTQLQRQLDFQKLEPMLYGLMILMLCAFATVLIVSIIQACTRDYQQTASDEWMPKMRAKREEHLRRNDQR